MSENPSFRGSPEAGETFTLGALRIVGRVIGAQSGNAIELYDLVRGNSPSIITCITQKSLVRSPFCAESILRVIEGEIEFTVAGEKFLRKAGPVPHVPCMCRACVVHVSCMCRSRLQQSPPRSGACAGAVQPIWQPESLFPYAGQVGDGADERRERLAGRRAHFPRRDQLVAEESCGGPASHRARDANGAKKQRGWLV
jgi:hypothetical protein